MCTSQLTKLINSYTALVRLLDITPLDDLPKIDRQIERVVMAAITLTTASLDDARAKL
jgi:hypothetical protein